MDATLPLSAFSGDTSLHPGRLGRTGNRWSLIHVHGTLLKSCSASGCHLVPTEAFSEDRGGQGLSGQTSLTLVVQCHAYYWMLGVKGQFY